jgi:hypothetical protein
VLHQPAGGCFLSANSPTLASSADCFVDDRCEGDDDAQQVEVLGLAGPLQALVLRRLAVLPQLAAAWR